MQIKLYPIGDLVPDSANARKHSDRNIEAIMDSIREFGQYQPIVIQKSTRRILAGNGRFEALKKLGAKDVQCVEADVDNITATRLALADNRTAELAEWDVDMLTELVGQLDIENNPLPGWNVDELSILMHDTDIDALFSDEALISKNSDNSNTESDSGTETRVFYLSKEQAEAVDNALSRAAEMYDLDDVETFGNTDVDGNMLYQIIAEWAE